MIYSEQHKVGIRLSCTNSNSTNKNDNEMIMVPKKAMMVAKLTIKTTITMMTTTMVVIMCARETHQYKNKLCLFHLTWLTLPKKVLVTDSNGWKWQLCLIIDFDQDRLRELEILLKTLSQQVQQQENCSTNCTGPDDSEVYTHLHFYIYWYCAVYDVCQS